MENEKLSKVIDYLFNRYWDENLTEEEEDKLYETAKNVVAEYGWKSTYQAALEFLHTECTTPESAVNFAHNFWGCYWYDKPIPNPYEFLAYFYDLIDFDAIKYDPVDILDSLATTILPKAGYKNADLFLNPRYMPENDPKLKEAVDKLRKSKAK